MVFDPYVKKRHPAWERARRGHDSELVPFMVRPPGPADWPRRGPRAVRPSRFTAAIFFFFTPGASSERPIDPGRKAPRPAEAAAGDQRRKPRRDQTGPPAEPKTGTVVGPVGPLPEGARPVHPGPSTDPRRKGGLCRMARRWRNSWGKGSDSTTLRLDEPDAAPKRLGCAPRPPAPRKRAGTRSTSAASTAVRQRPRHGSWTSALLRPFSRFGSDTPRHAKRSTGIIFQCAQSPTEGPDIEGGDAETGNPPECAPTAMSTRTHGSPSMSAGETGGSAETGWSDSKAGGRGGRGRTFKGGEMGGGRGEKTAGRPPLSRMMPKERGRCEGRRTRRKKKSRFGRRESRIPD